MSSVFDVYVLVGSYRAADAKQASERALKDFVEFDVSVFSSLDFIPLEVSYESQEKSDESTKES